MGRWLRKGNANLDQGVNSSTMVRLDSLGLRYQRSQDSLAGKLNERIVGEAAILNLMPVVIPSLIEAMIRAQIQTAMDLPRGMMRTKERNGKMWLEKCSKM